MARYKYVLTNPLNEYDTFYTNQASVRDQKIAEGWILQDYEVEVYL